MRPLLVPILPLFAAVFVVLAPPISAQDDLALARKVAEANNASGVALYHEFAKDRPGNLVFSPFSLSSALALAATGARGQTEQELRQALRLGLSREQVAAGYAGMAKTFVRAVRGNQAPLTVATSLWPQRGYAVTTDFLALAQQQFGAEVLPLDYAEPVAAAERINGWATAKTAGLITDVISPATLTPQTRLTLCSAVHFKAVWAHEFPEKKTTPAKFTLLDGKRVEVPTMRQTAWFPVAKENGGQLLRLPYAAGFEMVIVLPNDTVGLPALEMALDAATLNAWLIEADSARMQYLALELPKFKTMAQPDCTAALAKLGVKAAFDLDVADFSGIASKTGLAIGEVLQKAVIDVNESGTEAAASVAVLAACSVGMPKPFRVDHPFLFLIREKRTGVILFMGRVVDPRAG